jgi:hypothetical protein
MRRLKRRERASAYKAAKEWCSLALAQLREKRIDARRALQQHLRRHVQQYGFK